MPLADYNYLVNTVTTLCNRPDLAATGEIGIAVQAATLKLHQRSYYSLDNVDKQLVAERNDFFHQIDLSLVFPLYRKISYLRKWNPSATNILTNTQIGQATSGFIRIITDPAEALGSYREEINDVAYISGATILNMRLGTSEQYFLCGYFANPNLTPATWNSWISVQAPFAIIFQALADLYASALGLEDQANAMKKGQLAEWLAIVDALGTTGKGY
jgi:hypothetical protein